MNAARGPATVRLHFDFLSPYAYLAQHRLREMAAQHGWAIDYRAIDLGRAKAAIGNIGPANRDMPVKLAHLARDLQRWASLYGVPLVFPPNFRSARLNTGLYFEPCRGREAQYVASAYRQVWGWGRAPDERATLQQVAAEMGWDPQGFAAFVDSDEGSSAYTAATDEAIARQVFGVPTMAVGDETWWGNDRLFLLEKFLTKETKQ